jgi:hypothetical protein
MVNRELDKTHRPLVGVADPSEGLQQIDWEIGRYIPSYRELIEELGTNDKDSEPKVGLDAIIVPTSHAPTNLVESARVAHLAGTPIIYLCSGEATTRNVFEHLTKSNISINNIFAVQLPKDYNLPEIQFETDSAEIPGYDKTRDVNIKRNIGLAIARIVGWEHILFLDDDVEGLQQTQLSHMLRGFELPERQVVGWSYGDSNNGDISTSDNSSVIHAYKLIGGKVETFIGGGSTAVRVSDDTAFFPNIYNEDWFYYAAMMRQGRSAVARAGDLTQKPKHLFSDTATPIGEEFGDTLAEGLFRSIYFDRSLTDQRYVGERFWRFIDLARINLLKKLPEEFPESSIEIYQQAKASLAASLSSHEDTWPHLMSRFVEAWQQDLDNWRGWYNKLPYMPNVPAALNYLNLVKQ